jgi:hypothetical protein
MMTLQDIKAQSPRYAALSDEELADKMYDKYYADKLSRDDFNQKIGYTPEAPKAPESTLGKTNDVLKGINQYTLNRVKDVGQGAAESLPKFWQAVSKEVTPLLPKSVQQNPMVQGANNLINQYAPKLIQQASKLGSGQQGIPGQAFAESLGNYLPYAAVGGSKLPGQLAAGAAYGNVNSSPGSKLEGSIIGALTNAAPAGAMKGLEKSRPSVLLRGNLTPEELSKNLAETAGTQTGLGAVIGNKALQESLENTLPKFWLSGANQAMQNTAATIQGKGQSLLSKMLGTNTPEDVGFTLQEALKQGAKDVQATKRGKFAHLNSLTEKEGLKVGDDNLAAKASERLDEIKADPKLEREIPPSVLSDLEYYANPGEGSSVKSSDILRSVLGDKSYDNFIKGNKYISGIYGDLREAKKADIEDALNSTSNEEIKKARDDAMGYYKQMVVPFEDNDVTKFTKEGGDPDVLLSSFLKRSSVNDRSRLLNKLMSKLPDDKKNLVPYAYYSRAVSDEHGLDPTKMKTLHRALGNQQKGALFKDKDLQQAMNSYTNLVSKNEEPLRLFFNPKTGVRSSSFAPIASAGAGASMGFKFAGAPGAALGAILGAIGPGAVSRPFVNKLTSEKFRNSMVNEMLNPRKKFDKPKNVITQQALAQALMQSLVNNPGGQ